MPSQLKDLSANPENPRIVTDEKLAMLKKSLAEFGDLSGIIFNIKTNHLVGGHQRKEALPKDSKITIEKKYSKPTKVGTVAEGYVIANGERLSYREVLWTKSMEKAANISANKGAGEWDLDQLSKWMKELDAEKFNLSYTMFDDTELIPLLQEIEKINAGSEADEWAKMSDDTEFIHGKDFITLAVQFKTEKEREEFIKKTKLKVYIKRKTVWVAKP